MTFSQKYSVYNKIKIKDLPTKVAKTNVSKNSTEAIGKIRSDLKDFQETLYAHNRYGVLIVLQGMDASGKDGLVSEVFKEFNPRGVEAHSFKTPNSQQLEHDYLWRYHLEMPEKGKFTVFNRSYYENVLVTRVHPEYLLTENLPKIESVSKLPKDFWKNRFEQIINFENYLTSNGIIIIKFFLHISKEEQKKRLLHRLDDERKNWKFSETDLKEREHWDEYMKCYEELINKTSTKATPWFVIPADDKEMAHLMVAKIMLSKLKKFTDIKEPKFATLQKQKFLHFRSQLLNED